jgi:hypothetical protein
MIIFYEEENHPGDFTARRVDRRGAAYYFLSTAPGSSPPTTPK